MADPASNQDDLDDAELGAAVDHQTPGDHADARPADEDHESDLPGDDSKADSDPLALAQQESAPEAKPAPKPTAPAATKAEPQPPKPKTTTTTKQPAAEAKPSDPPATDDDALLKEALEDLPEEDWRDGKLSHKSKSAFLSQRKAIKRLSEQVAPLRKAKDDFDAVEKLRQEQGLEPEEFVHVALIEGAVKRGDPRAIPVLEKRLADLRKRAGIAAPQPQAPAQPAPASVPAIDAAEILAEIEAAEADFDFDRLAKLKAKLKPAGKPATPAAPVQQQAPASEQQQRQQPAQPVAQQVVDAETSEYLAMGDALAGLGVGDPVEHVRTLMTRFPDLAQVPAGQRLRAVLAKHQEVESAKAQAPRRTAGQPLSGRGGPTRAAGGQTTTDPLKHAMRP